MNFLILFFSSLILGIFLMFCSAAAMIEKRNLSLFLLFFVLGIGFCYGSAFVLEGLMSVALSVLIYLKFVALATGLLLVKENAIR